MKLGLGIGFDSTPVGDPLSQELWNDATSVAIGTGWSLAGDVWTHSGTVSGEVRSQNGVLVSAGLVEDQTVRIDIDVISGTLQTIQLGGAPTNGFNQVFNTPAGNHIIDIVAESLAAVPQLRFISSFDGVQIRINSMKIVL